MSQEVRVRFAPSPTGHLHIGGARTALFNYLFAKKHHGKLILRLEDTDAERSTQASVDMILDDLKWLGLTWDEGPEIGGDFGPYRQTERVAIYQEKVEQLLEQGDAYYCFCSQEEVDAMREAAKARGEDPKYDGRCRQLSLEKAKQRVANNEPYVIRFKAPQTGQTMIDDLVRGQVTFDNQQLDDFVIFRTNGLPTYNFAAVVDDAGMKMTHIIRGDDHLSNTPKQICIYQALKEPLPGFAHVPMILGSDKTRLSKRHGATSVGAYADDGYLPEAMINYLALLGWSLDDKTTIISKEELEEVFSLEKVGKTSAVFDAQKLLWMNGQYIRSIDEADYINRAIDYLQKKNIIVKDLSDDERNYARQVVNVVREKFKLFSELPEQVSYFFEEPKMDQLDEKADSKLSAAKEQPELFKSLYQTLQQVEVFDQPALEKALQAFIDEQQVKFGVLAHPMRVCLTGRVNSPGLFEIMVVLGKEKTINRLKAGFQKIEIDV